MLILQPVAWILVLAAFGPTLVDMVGHWRDSSWSTYSLVFVALFVREAIRASGQRKALALGVALVAIALLVQGLCLVAGRLDWSRVAFAICGLGLGLSFGRPPGARAALALLVVPVPMAFMKVGLQILARMLSVIGVQLEPSVGGAVPTVVVLAGSGLTLHPQDVGVLLAVLLGGLEWYRALELGPRLRAQLWALARGALVGVFIQALVVVLAVALAVSWRSDVAQRLLSLGPWCVGAAWLIYRAWSSRRLRPPVCA